MFDAYALMQAQEQLKIADEQFTQFLHALQGAAGGAASRRCRTARGSSWSCAGWRTRPHDRRGADQGPAEGAAGLDARAAADELRKAYDAIDQVLDVRQQAKFRVFEEVMERRKLELITRARRPTGRARNRQQ